MSVARVLPFLLALVLGMTVALVIGCGGDRSNLIPEASAQTLSDRLAAVKSALDDGRCTAVPGLVDQARAAALELGDEGVDRRLRARINEGIRALTDEAPRDCVAATATTTPPPETQTETIPTVTTPTETTTVPTTPTETTTVPTTPTETTPTDTTPVDTTPADPVVPPETDPVDPGTGGTEVPTP